MITRNYICDVCGNSVKENELFRITIELRNPGDAVMNKAKKDICNECLQKRGIITEKAKDYSKHIVNTTANQITFEQKFIELLESSGVQFAE